MGTLRGVVAAAMLCILLAGCGAAASAQTEHSPSPTPSPTPSWHQVAWVHDMALAGGIVMGKPFTVATGQALLQWRVDAGGLYKTSGVEIFIGPAAKRYGIDTGAKRYVHTTSDRPSGKLIHLDRGRYVITADVVMGDTVKVRLSQR